MQEIEFLSKGTYVVLPTKSNPRVLLSVDNCKLAKLAFKLYNPFSFKAKFLKKIVQFLCFNFNPLARIILPTIKVIKSDFIGFLENELNVSSLTSSVYIATIKDKLVLQLQSQNVIIGYVKYPLNKLGLKHLLNEKKAIEILSKKKLTEPFLLYETYNNTPFLIIKELEGEINIDNNLDIDLILNSYKKPQSFFLKSHPRIKQLSDMLINNDLQNYFTALQYLCELSQEVYCEVFEHGDFAPWNIIKSKSGSIPFDFEYFEVNGLEHLDAIKYHFQIECLLNGKKGQELINSVSAKIKLKEFKIIFKVFLIKEIVNKKESNQLFELEESLFKTTNYG